MFLHGTFFIEFIQLYSRVTYCSYEKICYKNRNSDYPVITNGAGEIINYPKFDNIDIEKILETLVDKYYMNGILIGKFNFKKRDYCKWIDIKKEELDEDKLIKVYLQSRFYLKIDDKNIIKNMNMPILDIQKNENIETCIQNLVENYDTLKTK